MIRDFHKLLANVRSLQHLHECTRSILNSLNDAFATLQLAGLIPLDHLRAGFAELFREVQYQKTTDGGPFDNQMAE